MRIENTQTFGNRITIDRYYYYPALREWYLSGQLMPIEAPEHLRIIELLFGP